MSNTQEPHLAEHPLDENDPITEEWLAARLDGTMFEGAFVMRPFVLSFNEGAWTLYCLHGKWVPVARLQTCGQVRLICRAFKVELNKP